MKPTWSIPYESRHAFPLKAYGWRLEITSYDHSSHQGRMDDAA